MVEIRQGLSIEEFSAVYKVFRGAPFFEAWTEKEIRKEYFELLEKGAWMWGYFENGECIGILTLYQCIPGEHPISFQNPKDVVYLSDIAVLEEYRRRGIGGKLFDEAISFSKESNFKLIYMRTNAKPGLSKSIGIAKRRGFQEMREKQSVNIERINGKVKDDLRMFLKKEL